MKGILNGFTAIVTGGTRGIGYAIVKKFIECGASVAICGSRQQTAEAALERALSEFPDAGVMAVWPELTNQESVAQAFSSVKRKFGRVDILANNAGITQTIPLYDYTEENIDSILDINVKAVIVCSQAAARLMREDGGGVIVNTSSMVGIYGQPTGCGYPASKFAVNGLTKSLARELAKDKIRVNAVAPGVVRTDMVGNLPENMLAPLLSRIPVGRMGEPEDIANAVAFLASPYASYINGAVLSVDGGVVL